MNRYLLVLLILQLSFTPSLTPQAAAIALPPTLPVTTCNVDDDGPADYATIQDAVDDPTCTVITVAAGVYTENVVIARNVTIDGAGAETTQVGGCGRVFDVDAAAVASISGMTVEGVYDDQGAGVYNNGTLTLTAVIITGNEADDGAGVYNNGTLTLLDSTVTGNLALWGAGAGLYNATDAQAVIHNSTFESNYANGGGAIYAAYDSQVTIVDSLLTANESAGGGAIVNGGTMTIDDSQLLNNVASNGNGGAISNSGTLTVTSSAIDDNSSAFFGGGIYLNHSANFWLLDSTVNGNSANNGGGIMGSAYSSNESTATIRRSTISGNSATDSGGGITTMGLLAVDGSTISANSATDNGGGISVNSSASASLLNSTISGNSAGADGGGIWNDGTLALDSVTVAANTADGSGGGVYSIGTATMFNALLGENTAHAATYTGPDCYGSLTSLGYNLVRDASYCSGLTATGDQAGTSSVPIEPYLLPLGDYGGPTEVHALQYTTRFPSPAVDAGAPSGCPSTDQRGLARPVDRDGDGSALCDIGAYESIAGEPADLRLTKTVEPAAAAPGEAVTFTLTIANDGIFDASGVVVTDTLPEALDSLGVSSSMVITALPATRYVWLLPDLPAGEQATITVTGVLSPGLTGGGALENEATVYSTNDTDPSNDNGTVKLDIVTCYATADDGATVYRSADAQAVRDAVAAAPSGGTVKIAGVCPDGHVSRLVEIAQDLTLHGGYSPSDWSTSDPNQPSTLDAQGYGTVIYVDDGIVTLENLNVTGGGSTSSGGGLYLAAGSVVMTHLHVYGNDAENQGGGLYVGAASAVLSASEVLSNTTGSTGGGLYVGSGNAVLTNTQIAGNSAGNSGGAIYLYSGQTTLEQCDITDNSAHIYGGGVALTHSSSEMTVNGGQIEGNSASHGGGGIYVAAGLLTLSQADVQFNNAEYDGAGLYLRDGEATLTGGQLTGNSAGANGGALYVIDGNATLTQVTLSNNSAGANGGGVYTEGGDTVLQRSYLSANSAANSGGGAHIVGGRVTLTRCTVADNSARNGAGTTNGGGLLTVRNSTLSQNTASGNGGGLRSLPGATSALTFTTIADNQAVAGGGIYRATGDDVRLTNTLLAGNDPLNCNVAITSGGYNLEDGDTCGLSAAGDQVDVDPLMEPLQDNGGDTPTHALRAGSPAIDAGQCLASILIDQRGEPRPAPGSAACDIGAYESDTPTPPDVAIVKTVIPTSAAPGQSITYTLAFSNAGSATASGVLINDTLPADLLGAHFSSSGAPVTRRSGTRYVWQVANLDSGVGGVITVSGVLREPLLAGTLVNSATIGAQRDEDSGNNSDAVSLTVLNVAPQADDVTAAALNEETVLHGSLQVSDDNGDALSYAIVTAPVRGSVTLGSSGQFTYTPTNRLANYYDSFTWVVSDTAGLDDTATVTIPVTADNDPPTISNIYNQHTEVDSSVGPLPFHIDDVDSPLASLTLDKASSNTTLVPLSNIVLGGSGTNRTVTVTPAAGLSGQALITITVSDGQTSRSDVFVLTVGTGNNPPEFISTPNTTATQGTSYAYQIIADDVDSGDTLTITAPVKPSWLTLIVHPNRTATLGGTPLDAHVGEHQVTLHVVDNDEASATQSFTITVANVNDPPLARDDTAHTDEGTPVSIDVLDNDDDLDDDPLTFVALGAPLYGSAAWAGGQVVYTPTNRSAPYNAVMTYTVSDGTLSDTGTITVAVSASDDPPVIGGLLDQETAQDVAAGPLLFVVDDADTPLNTLALDKASSNPTLIQPANIVLGGSGANRFAVITPTSGLSGEAVITITVSDSHSSTADSFLLHVIANSPPLFVSTPITAATQDLSYHYTVLAADADSPGGLTIAALQRPPWLALTDNGDGTAVLSGLPLNSTVGDHPVLLRVVDSGGAIGSQAFTVTVANVDDPPVARDDAVSTNERTPRPIVVLVNDEDPDGAPLAISAVGRPSYGHAVLDGDEIVYVPANRSVSYNAVLTYTASDGALSDTAVVTVAVSAVNDPPWISNIRNQRTASGTASAPIPFAVGDADTSLPALTLVKASSNTALVPPDNILLLGSSYQRALIITPTVGLTGTAIITMSISDELSTRADSFVLAVGMNSAPEFVTAPLTETLDGLVYVYNIVAVDADADVMTITAPLLPSWLTLTDWHDGQATLEGTPAVTDVGDHPVTLRVADLAGASTEQSFVIAVGRGSPTYWIYLPLVVRE